MSACTLEDCDLGGECESAQHSAARTRSNNGRATCICGCPMSAHSGQANRPHAPSTIVQPTVQSTAGVSSFLSAGINSRPDHFYQTVAPTSSRKAGPSTAVSRPAARQVVIKEIQRKTTKTAKSSRRIGPYIVFLYLGDETRKNKNDTFVLKYDLTASARTKLLEDAVGVTEADSNSDDFTTETLGNRLDRFVENPDSVTGARVLGRSVAFAVHFESDGESEILDKLVTAGNLPKFTEAKHISLLKRIGGNAQLSTAKDSRRQHPSLSIKYVESSSVKLPEASQYEYLMLALGPKSVEALLALDGFTVEQWKSLCGFACDQPKTSKKGKKRLRSESDSEAGRPGSSKASRKRKGKQRALTPTIVSSEDDFALVATPEPVDPTPRRRSTPRAAATRASNLINLESLSEDENGSNGLAMPMEIDLFDHDNAPPVNSVHIQRSLEEVPSIFATNPHLSNLRDLSQAVAARQDWMAQQIIDVDISSSPTDDAAPALETSTPVGLRDNGLQHWIMFRQLLPGIVEDNAKHGRLLTDGSRALFDHLMNLERTRVNQLPSSVANFAVPFQEELDQSSAIRLCIDIGKADHREVFRLLRLANLSSAIGPGPICEFVTDILDRVGCADPSGRTTDVSTWMERTTLGVFPTVLDSQRDRRDQAVLFKGCGRLWRQLLCFNNGAPPTKFGSVLAIAAFDRGRLGLEELAQLSLPLYGLFNFLMMNGPAVSKGVDDITPILPQPLGDRLAQARNEGAIRGSDLVWESVGQRKEVLLDLVYMQMPIEAINGFAEGLGEHDFQRAIDYFGRAQFIELCTRAQRVDHRDLVRHIINYDKSASATNAVAHLKELLETADQEQLTSFVRYCRGSYTLPSSVTPLHISIVSLPDGDTIDYGDPQLDFHLFLPPDVSTCAGRLTLVSHPEGLRQRLSTDVEARRTLKDLFWQLVCARPWQESFLLFPSALRVPSPQEAVHPQQSTSPRAETPELLSDALPGPSLSQLQQARLARFGPPNHTAAAETVTPEPAQEISASDSDAARPQAQAPNPRRTTKQRAPVPAVRSRPVPSISRSVEAGPSTTTSRSGRTLQSNSNYRADEWETSTSGPSGT